jgi:DNA repair protein SbcC/Rad50
LIPVTLTLRGFLSYKDQVTIDLSAIEVACISGSNGAGKSSLLDAITWVLFGKARVNDDALINDSADSCLVALEFDYENERYRVQREKPRGKGTQLEFQMRSADGVWKPLTEAGLRPTEERIRDVLRLDYDTFINASFFLQGKADMFTQQAPARRKEILSSILGLEIWEDYRNEASIRRRDAANEVKSQRALLDEVIAELEEEAERKEKLSLLSSALDKTSALRAESESLWTKAQEQAQELRSQNEQLLLIQKQIEGANARLATINLNITSRTDELERHEKLIGRAGAIESSFQDWQAQRSQLERWNSLANDFHAFQNEHSKLDALIREESARLKQELNGLQLSRKEIDETEARLPGLKQQAASMTERYQQAENRLKELTILEGNRDEAKNRHSELSAEYRQLKVKKEEIEGHREALASATGSSCPLCGQDLTESHREEMRASLDGELTQLSELMSAKTTEGLKAQQGINELDKQINELKTLREKLTSEQKSLGALNAQVEQIEEKTSQWKREGYRRLCDLEKIISEESFCSDLREKIKVLDEKIKSVGYDAAAHEETRKAELDARAFEEEYRALEKARTAVEGLRRELLTLAESKTGAEEEISSQKVMADSMQAKLSKQKEDLPDLTVLQTELNALKAEENRLRQETGGARQMVDVLENRRRKKAELDAKIEDYNQQITRLKMLETAFGKDGIPAMLIEEALPEIESQANDILDRLSGGSMSISFETEKEFKDKNREDKKPTLDILISDSAGRREYELFSGGEAFRINFAIRLSLSRVLAGRAGARLRTLVIDEGFGSQDADGRQRLIEAINMVRPDFAKILVITHLEELKDAFSSRIEVTKTGNGSVVEVIP